MNNPNFWGNLQINLFIESPNLCERQRHSERSKTKKMDKMRKTRKQ